MSPSLMTGVGPQNSLGTVLGTLSVRLEDGTRVQVARWQTRPGGAGQPPGAFAGIRFVYSVSKDHWIQLCALARPDWRSSRQTALRRWPLAIIVNPSPLDTGQSQGWSSSDASSAASMSPPPGRSAPAAPWVAPDLPVLWADFAWGDLMSQTLPSSPYPTAPWATILAERYGQPLQHIYQVAVGVARAVLANGPGPSPRFSELLTIQTEQPKSERAGVAWRPPAVLDDAHVAQLDAKLNSTLFQPVIVMLVAVQKPIRELHSGSTETRPDAGALEQWVLVGPQTVQRSKFVGAAHWLTSPDQVRSLLDQAARSVIRRWQHATHNIVAWAIPAAGVAGTDVDGEGGADRVMANALAYRALEPGVLVIVSRWYGGILLGPQRFRIIRDTAVRAMAELERTVPRPKVEPR